MELSKIIENRYSCRDYTAEAVSDEKLEYIKECVRLAPSAVNKQPWRFRIIKQAQTPWMLWQGMVRYSPDVYHRICPPRSGVGTQGRKEPRWHRYCHCRWAPVSCCYRTGTRHLLGVQFPTCTLQGTLQYAGRGRTCRNNPSRTSCQRNFSKETQGREWGIYWRVIVVHVHKNLILIIKTAKNLLFY